MSTSQPSIPLNAIVEETPSGTVSRMPSQPTLFGAETLEEEKDHGEHPPTTHPDFSRGRRNSSVSRVDVDFFDPAGVQDLRRTMSKQLGDSDEQAKGRPSSISTDETIRVREDEPFDLEKMLRRAVRKYAL
jgi:ATP-binding cassette subfamily G (WHITE) protein 2 (SNQ2)